MRAITNPGTKLIQSPRSLGTIDEAARVADVKPGTIRVWVSRGKLQPVDLGDNGPELYHLPTVALLRAAGRNHQPADPAANSRGPHNKRAA